MNIQGAKLSMSRTKGIYKRGNVYWIRYADSEGNMHYQSTKSRSKKVAEALLITRKKEAQDGMAPVKVQKIGAQRFSDLAEQYSLWAERQRSYERSKKYFIKALVQEFGNLPVRKLNGLLTEKYVTKLLNSGKKPGTVNRHLACLKHMATKAVEWEMAEEILLKRIQKVKFLPENNQRLRFLDEEDSQALIQQCPPHLKPIVITALNTGMRREEILSLEWEKNVDLKNRLILLHRTKNGQRREIPINNRLFKALNGLPRHINSPYLFCDGKGKRYQTISKAFNRAVKKA